MQTELDLGSILSSNPWRKVRDGNLVAAELFRRHYSYRPYADGRRNCPYYRNRNLICGPGEKLVLITSDSKALFVWRKYINDAGQTGVNCAIFRNEGPLLSSQLILAAEHYAYTRWPGQRLYTYVDPSKICGSNPGFCYRVAGWQRCGKSKKGLLIFEKHLRCGQ